MQKLGIINSIMNILKTERGSVLVAAVVFSIIAGIAATGYLVVTNNTVTQEVIALDDARAFYAAESGLLIATRWLSIPVNWNSITNTAVTMSYNLNGMIVNVTLGPKNTGVNTNDTIIPIAAQARGGALKYTKELSWNARILTGGSHSMIVNDMSGLGTKGIAGCVFDGPSHFNDDIAIFGGQGNTPKFISGPVTVHSTSTPWNEDSTKKGSSPYYNNYNYGVYSFSNPNNKSWDISDYDLSFMTPFMHHQPLLAADVSWKDNDTILLTDPGTYSAKMDFFENGDVKYKYGPNASEETTLSNLNGKVLLMAPDKSISVQGTVKGKCAVVTRGTGNINIDGNLVYQGWDNWQTDIVSKVGNEWVYHPETNFGLGFEDTNMISLVCAEKQGQPGVSGDININITTAGTYCIAGFLFSLHGKIDKPFSNVQANVYLVGGRSANTIDPDHWDPGSYHNCAFLFDRRIPRGIIAQTGIKTNLLSNNGSGWHFVLDLYWTERNF